MPLSDPAPRRFIHRRLITCEGYLREDGLWDIEGHLRDTKGYTFSNKARGTLEPGDALHEMWLRLTIDETLTIHAVEAVTDAGPYAACPAITGNFQRLVGLRIGPGWRKELRSRVGGVEGCTHLFEMLPALATAAVQSIYPWLARRDKDGPFADRDASGDAKDKPDLMTKGEKPFLVDSCHIYDSRGPVVKEQWPEWYTGEDNDTESS